MCPRLFRLACLAGALAAAPGASARPARADDGGLVIGARVGYASPFGDVVRDGASLEDVADAKLPIWLELGYRFDRRVRGELYLEVAPASVADGSCAPDVPCSAADVRFGVAVRFHLAPAALLDPWIGLGVGLEMLRAEVFDPGPFRAPGRYELRWSGIELPLEVGLEIAVADRISLGPYLSVSVAQFTSVRERPVGGASATGALDARATHGWLQLGLAASLRL